MHEIGLMEEVLRIVDRHSSASGNRRVQRIRLRVGALSGVVPDALTFAFEALKDRTSAREACLELEPVPVRCTCRSCEENFTPPDIIYACPGCGALSADILQGKELEIAELEVF